MAAPALRPFSSNDLLWLEVRADGALLAESMDAYASRGGVYLPLGQFARVLDLAVAVTPEQKRAEGWVLDRKRTLELDVKTKTLLLAGAELHFTDEQVAAFDDDIYVRLDLLEVLFPIRARADIAAQLLTIVTLEPLPFQQRLARDSRRKDMTLARAERPDRVIAAPYLAVSPPAFDVNIGGQMSRDGRDQSRRFDLRAAGDLAYAGFQGYVGSNEQGEINDVRLLLERKDNGGRALGGPFSALGATRVGVGDIFSPASPLGATSYSGRGLFYSSAPLETLDLSTPLDLRGELAVGEEVELYVNETLRGSQTTPVEGRYQFLNVPLAVGLNTIRLVFYGSQGQRREETRRVNVGPGQVRPGQVVVQFAALQQGLSVIDPVVDKSDASVGDQRLILLADYGVSSALTLSGGLARFTPLGQAPRISGNGGLRASVGGSAVQLDLAADDLGGRAAGLAVAGRVLDIGVVGHHSQYAGGFIDETRQAFASDTTRLTSSSELNVSGNLQFTDTLIMPVSIDWRRVSRDDGSHRMTSEGRTSAALGRYYVSASVFHEMESEATWTRNELGGRFDVATLVSHNIQARGGFTYRNETDLGIDSAYGSVDIRLPRGDAIHLGVIRTGSGASDTSFQGSYLRHSRAFDIAANASYETSSQAWRIGLQLGFAFAYDPAAGGYRFAAPGVSSSGTAVMNAYIDSNNDGVRQADEPAVAGVKFDTPSGPVVTNAKGHAFAGGLGDGGKVRLRADADALDDPFLSTGSTTVTVAPRMGRTIVVDYPLLRRSEVEVTIMLQRSGDASARPLAAVNLELIPAGGGPTLSARTDHAGIGFFEGVPSGRYQVVLQAEQAATLGLVLVSPAALTAPEKGGFVNGGKVLVRFKRDAQ